MAALWENPETEIEAVHLAVALAYHGLLRVPSRAETSDVTPRTYPISPLCFRYLIPLCSVSILPGSPPALSFSTLIWRYVRQFVKLDAKEALQYVCTVCLSADQGEVGKEQVEIAWELVRRIIVLAKSGPAWEELVGGFRADGSRFVRWICRSVSESDFFFSSQSGVIEQGAPLLCLTDNKQYSEHILVRAARHSEEDDRIAEAIKLYNLADDYSTVVACLAATLGNTIAQPGPDEKSRGIERTASEILRHYERTNRAVGKNRDAVVKLLRVREAIEAKENGKPEVALEVLESTDLIPLSGDVAKITKRAEEFKDLHESLQRNLQVYLPLTMNALAGVHQKVKSTMVADATRQMVRAYYFGSRYLLLTSYCFFRRWHRFARSRAR